jgi:hypothetical protein
MRMKMFPIFAVTLAIFSYIYLSGEMKNPMEVQLSRSNILCIFTLLFGINISLVSISASRDSGAKWIYNFIPEGELKSALNGGWRVIWYYILAPILLFHFALYLLKFGLLIASIHTLMTGLLMKIYFNIASSFATSLPLSQSEEKISSIQKILLGVIPLPVVFIFVGVERMIYSFKFTMLGVFTLLLIERFIKFFTMRKIKTGF